MHDSFHVEEHHAIASYGRDAFMSCTNPWHNAMLVFQVYDSAAAAPATTSIERLPQDYLETVRHTHERGIDGSRGCFASRAGALFFGVTKRILSCNHQLCGACPTLEMPTITQVVSSSPADATAYLSNIAVDMSRLHPASSIPACGCPCDFHLRCAADMTCLSARTGQWNYLVSDIKHDD